jgi:hypothetical protein
MAILVRNNIGAFEVGKESGYYIFIRVFGGPIKKPCIIGNIHRPHERDVFRRVEKEIKDQVHQLRLQYPMDPIIIMGDWNKKRAQVASQISGWPTPMVLVDVEGDPRTFTNTRRKRIEGQEGEVVVKKGGDIDHIIVSVPHCPLLGKVRIQRLYTISDHWPIVVSMEGQREVRINDERGREVFSGLPYKPGPLTKDQMEEEADRWRAVNSHNQWAPLLEMLDNAGEGDEEREQMIDTVAAAFTTTSYDVARGLGMSTKVKKSRREVQVFWSSRHKRWVRRRSWLHQQLRRTSCPIRKQTLQLDYDVAKERCKEINWAEGKTIWLK